MAVRISRRPLPSARMLAASRATPVQMSQPKLIGSNMKEPSARASMMKQSLFDVWPSSMQPQ
jgi:hypothetical protein